MTEIELSNRQLEILSAIIASYVKSGEPVSSGTVYAVLKLNVCTSTIRSDMSELTAGGFIRKIHASSGSIPSARGYKLYADKIVNKLPGTEGDVPNKVDAGQLLNLSGRSFEGLVYDLLNVVSKSTDCLALFYFENPDSIKVSKVRLVKITDFVVCVFVVFSNGSIRSKILRNTKPFNETELSCAEDLLEKSVVGIKLKDFSVVLLQNLVAENGVGLPCLSDVLGEIVDLTESFLEDNFYFSNVPAGMFRGFENQLDALPVLGFMKDKFLLNGFIAKNKSSKDGITVSVGRENSYLGLEDFSIISSTFSTPEKVSGGFGIIGPMRMDYSSVIYKLAYVSPFFRELLLHSTEEILSKNGG